MVASRTEPLSPVSRRRNKFRIKQWNLIAILTRVGDKSCMCRKKTPKRLRIPSISNAEWAVMQVIWSMGKATANEVVEALSGHMEWKPKTIHTLLRRLSDKGVLSFEQIGREYVFTARLTSQECQLAESRSFLSRVFGTDTVTPLVAAFARQEEISPAEIAELRLLLDKLESDSAS